MGFCDPAPGRTKLLLVYYLFKAQPYRATIMDAEPAALPGRCVRPALRRRRGAGARRGGLARGPGVGALVPGPGAGAGPVRALRGAHAARRRRLPARPWRLAPLAPLPWPPPRASNNPTHCAPGFVAQGRGHHRAGGGGTGAGAGAAAAGGGAGAGGLGRGRRGGRGGLAGQQQKRSLSGVLAACRAALCAAVPAARCQAREAARSGACSGHFCQQALAAQLQRSEEEASSSVKPLPRHKERGIRSRGPGLGGGRVLHKRPAAPALSIHSLKCSAGHSRHMLWGMERVMHAAMCPPGEGRRKGG